MSELFKFLLIWIGIFHLFFGLLGFLNLVHYRVYIGPEDKIMVLRSEYEELKALRDKHD